MKHIGNQQFNFLLETLLTNWLSSSKYFSKQKISVSGPGTNARTFFVIFWRFSEFFEIALLAIKGTDTIAPPLF
jgi:hypothetical protein